MKIMDRAVASLPLPGGQDKNISSIFPFFPAFSLIFPQFFLIFFLNAVVPVGESPTREGPGYATDYGRICFACVVGKKPNTPNLSQMTDNAITRGGMWGLGSPCLVLLNMTSLKCEVMQRCV